MMPLPGPPGLRRRPGLTIRRNAMSKDAPEGWVPFRPKPRDLEAIARDVAEVGAIQQRLVERHPDLKVCDRVAHQYQIAGGKVLLQLDDALPAPLAGVGLFQPGARFTGIGRVSTGLGTPHLETNPDFLGLMLAFQTAAGKRVDFLAINDPAAPTDNHREFVDVLHATAEAAGAEMPLVGDWGAYDVFNLVAEQKEMVAALKARMGWKKAGMTAFHLTRQTIRTFFSSSAYQTYWTGIHEVGGTAGKFSLVPSRDVNGRPDFRPGERHLSEDWRRRQSEGDLDFILHWIPYLREAETPSRELTEAWREDHKVAIGRAVFPKQDPRSPEARLWALLATEMGANPGNWVHDAADSIGEPATVFTAARKAAYALSQKGRGALAPEAYAAVFESGRIDKELARELERRHDRKISEGHRCTAAD